MQSLPAKELENADPNQKKEEEHVVKKQKQIDSDEEEENLTPAERKMWEKIDEVLKDHYLSAFQMLAAKKFIKDKVGNRDCQEVERLREWLFMKVNGRKLPEKYHPRQLGCPDLVPGLSLQGWWDTSGFPFIKELEAALPVIKEELLNLRGQDGFQPYRSPNYASKNTAEDGIGSLGTDSGSWNVFYLYLHDIPFTENCEKVPKTIEILKKIVPRNYFHAFLSAAAPGTHIVQHNGPTGKKLRCHLPLLNVEGARMRVGDEMKYLKEGECILFDDSFNHEAWHDGDKTRINLIFDFWHPELSDAEVKFFSMLLKSKLKGDKMLAEKFDNNDHLYSIIEQTKHILKGKDDWWLH